MLYIHFGHLNNGKELTAVDPYFNRFLQSKKDLVDDEFSREILLDVEGTKVISNYVIETKYIGIVSSEKISGGVKAVLLMKHCPEVIVNASRCGDNCAKWIQRLGREQDITIALQHMMKFSDPFEGVCMNTGKKLNCFMDYADAYFEWCEASSKDDE